MTDNVPYKTLLNWLNVQGCEFRIDESSEYGFGWFTKDGIYLSATAMAAYEMIVKQRLEEYMQKHVYRYGQNIEALVEHTAKHFKNPQWIADTNHSIWQIAYRIGMQSI